MWGQVIALKGLHIVTFVYCQEDPKNRILTYLLEQQALAASRYHVMSVICHSHASLNWLIFAPVSNTQDLLRPLYHCQRENALLILTEASCSSRPHGYREDKWVNKWEEKPGNEGIPCSLFPRRRQQQSSSSGAERSPGECSQTALEACVCWI